MTEQDPDESTTDIYPRDQMEHYKIELARLRSENKHLAGEVDYLRQALAAALSKIPQLEASVPTNNPTSPKPSGSSATPADEPAPLSSDDRQSSEQIAALRSYRGYFPLASFIAPPVVLLMLLLLTLVCSVTLFGLYLLLGP